MHLSNRARIVICKSAREDLDLIGEWLAQEKLKISIDQIFHNVKMQAAMEYKESNEKKGIMVIKVQDG
jgi:NADPH:quinone reductase-like Zn-dependent oxidoreductase